MSVFAKNYRKQFQIRMLYLDHDEPSDFYLSSCQNNGSAFPLLFVRGLVFFGCISIFLASATVTSDTEICPYWPIFLTSWGLVLLTLTSSFALIVSLRAYFGGPIEPLGLPWYMKIYWALFNLTLPVTFFITSFYWSILYNRSSKFMVDPVLSVFVHAVNSILMVGLLIFSRQPSRLLHCIYPLIAAACYITFSMVYYFAGGTNQYGSPYIYPMLNWSEPSTAVATVLGSVVMLIIMHLLIVATSTGRNWVTDRYWRKRSMDIVQIR